MFNLAAASSGLNGHMATYEPSTSTFSANSFLSSVQAQAANKWSIGGAKLLPASTLSLPISLAGGMTLQGSNLSSKTILNESDDSDEHFNRHLENLRNDEADSSLNKTTGSVEKRSPLLGQVGETKAEPPRYPAKPKTPVVAVEATEPPTPMGYSRSSSMTSLNSFDAKSVHSSVASEYSLLPSKLTSPAAPEAKDGSSSTEEEEDGDIDDIDITIPESPAAPNDSFINAKRVIHKQQQIQYRQSAILAMESKTTLDIKPVATSTLLRLGKDESNEFQFNKAKPIVFDFGVASKFAVGTSSSNATSASFLMNTPPVKLAPKFAQPPLVPSASSFTFSTQPISGSGGFLAGAQSTKIHAPMPFTFGGQLQPSSVSQTSQVTYAFMKSGQSAATTASFSLGASQTVQMSAQPKFLMNRQPAVNQPTFLAQTSPGLFAMKPMIAQPAMFPNLNRTLTNSASTVSTSGSSSSLACGSSFDEAPVVFTTDKYHNSHATASTNVKNSSGSNHSSPPESVCSRMSNASVPSLIRADINKGAALFNTIIQKVGNSGSNKSFRDMLLNLNINDLQRATSPDLTKRDVAQDDGEQQEHHEYCCDEDDCPHDDEYADEEKPEKFETEDELVLTFQKGASLSEPAEAKATSGSSAGFMKFGQPASCLTPPSGLAKFSQIDKVAGKFPGFHHLSMPSGAFMANKSPAASFSTPLASARLPASGQLNFNDSMNNCTYSPQVFNHEGSMSRYSSVSSLDNLDDLDNDDDDTKNRVIIQKLCNKKLFGKAEPECAEKEASKDPENAEPSGQNISASSLGDTDENSAVHQSLPASNSKGHSVDSDHNETSSSANNSELNGTLDQDDLILENFINEMLPSVLSTASFQPDQAATTKSPAVAAKPSNTAKSNLRPAARASVDKRPALQAKPLAPSLAFKPSSVVNKAPTNSYAFKAQPSSKPRTAAPKSACMASPKPAPPASQSLKIATRSVQPPVQRMNPSKATSAVATKKAPTQPVISTARTRETSNPAIASNKNKPPVKTPLTNPAEKTSASIEDLSSVSSNSSGTRRSLMPEATKKPTRPSYASAVSGRASVQPVAKPTAKATSTSMKPAAGAKAK